MFQRPKLAVLRIWVAVAVAAAPVALVAGPASAATTFSNGTSIGLQDPNTTGTDPAQATLYPSPITVSGQTGTISNLTVTLTGINYSYMQDLGVLLVGPGNTLVIMSGVGSNDQYLQGNTSDLNVTLADSSSNTYAYNATVPVSGTITMTPRDNTVNSTDDFPSPPADTFPSGPSSFARAASTGTATLGSVFNGTNPNGTWKLYVTTDTYGDGTGSISGGWSLDITTASTLASTTTALSSDNNPSFTSGAASSVVLKATVTSAAGTVTGGTVDFTDGSTTISGCGAVTLTAGQATCTTSFSAEGAHSLQADYSGTTSGSPEFVTSTGSFTQVANDHTTVSGNSFANTGAITIPPSTVDSLVAVPYPSDIFVSGLTGTIGDVSATISGLNYPYSQDLDLLLVAPDGNSEVLMADVGPSTGGTAATNDTVTFDDSAASALGQNTSLGTSSNLATRPVDYPGNATDTFPAPAPAGPYGIPAPRGSATLGEAFDGSNPNGTWSLYVETDSPGDGAGSVSGGWSLDISTGNEALPPRR